MKIIAGNFKANLTRAQVAEYINTLKLELDSNPSKNKVYIFPSHTALLDNNINSFSIGAQNAYPANSGGFTGEIGLDQLKEFNINSILIGHSERRNVLKEDRDIIASKFRFYMEHGFEIFYCIGEDLSIRQQGDSKLKDFLSEQLSYIDTSYPKLIVAYEPIWAIGTGISASAKEIESTHKILSNLTKAPLLYGGSVNAANASEILNIDNVNGVLVGSASLSVNSFLDIIRA